MLYERYADKIKRIAAVRDIILRFKFLIIGVLVANFILTVCFLATQGMILGGIKGETEYTYGNDVEFRATALFSLRPSMEYSSDGGETWEKEAPVMPGEYKVRAKTHRMFVIPQRSESVDFVISKKNLVLTLKDNEVEWRAIPSVNTDGLVRGDALSSVEVVVDSTAIGEATADIMESTACITSPDGNDVTGAYNITAEDGTVNVIAKLVTLKANDVTKTYDGTPLAVDGYTVVDGGVIEGHTLDVSFNEPALTNVGSKDIKITGVKIFEGSEDVTEFYRVLTQDGVAKVTKRPVSIVAHDFEKVYDGEALNLTSFTLTDADGDHRLPAGDEWDIRASAKTVESNLTDPQEIIGYVGYAGIKNGEHDVSSNYKITLDNGNVKITKRPIKITMQDFEKEYDGNTITLTSPTHYTVDGEFVLDHGVVVDFKTPSEYVLACKNKPYDVEYYLTVGGVKNTRISKNYDVTFVNEAFITVTSKVIEVTAHDITEIVYSATDIVASQFIGNQITYVEYLGKQYSFTVDFTDKAYRNAGTYDYTLDCRVWLDGVDVSGEFDIIIDYTGTNSSKIVIDPYEVTVTLKDVTKIYDGKAVAETECITVNKTLIGGDRLVINDFNTDCINVLYDKSGNVIAYNVTISHSFDLTIGSYAGNYEITYEDNKRDVNITVNPMTVRITANDYAKMYDGNAAEFKNVNAVKLFMNNGTKEYSGDDSYPLVGSDTLILGFGGDAKHVNVRRDADGNVIAYEYTVDYTVTDAKDATVTDKIIDNYDVEVIYTTDSNADLKTDCSLIKIYPIAVSVTANNVSRYYDGTEYKITDSGLLTLMVSKTYDFANGAYTSYSTVGLATLDGKQQSYYEIFKYKEDKNDKIAKIAVAFGESQEIKNVKRDADRKVVPYEYTVNWLLYDCIVDNYEVTVSYQEGRNDVLIDTGYYSTITIEPVIVNIKANDYSKIYDDTAVRITDDGVITNVSVQELKIDGSYLTVSKELAVLDGKKQSYYDLVSYVDGKTTVVEKMILHFVDADTGNIVDGYVDVKRDADGGIVAYSYNVIGEMLDGALLSNYELAVSYESYDVDDITGEEIEFSRIYIDPRPVYVTTESEEFDFDGKAHSYPVGKIEAGEDIDGDKILDTGILSHHKKKEADGVWSDFLEMTLVGTKTNTVSFNIIASEGGADKTSNYEIVCVGGTLTVKPLSVSFKASSVKGEYIGKTFDIAVKSYKNVTLLDGDEILFVRAETKQVDAGTGKSYISLAVIKTCYGYEIYTFDGKNATVRTYQRDVENKDMQIVVADGQYIVISANDSVSFHTYDLANEVYSDENAIWCEDIGEESYSYYKFDNVDGKVVVLPREVIILCSSETAEFGPLTGTAIVTKDNMIDGHYLYFVTSGEAVEEGVTVINTVRIEDIQIYSSAEMTPETLLPEYVKDNYKFTIKDGTLLIK